MCIVEWCDGEVAKLWGLLWPRSTIRSKLPRSLQEAYQRSGQSCKVPIYISLSSNAISNGTFYSASEWNAPPSTLAGLAHDLA